MHRSSRRRLLGSAFGLAALAALAACGATPTPTTAPAKPAEPAKAAEPPKPAAEPPKPAAATAAPAAPAKAAEPTKPAAAPAAAGKPAGVAPATVRVYSNWTAGARAEYMKWLKKNFEEDTPGLTMEQEFAPGEQFLEKLYTMIAGNTMPDLAMMFGRDAGTYIGKGAFLDITPRLKNANFNWDTYLTSDMAMFEHQGKTYGLPHLYTVPCIAANIGLFAKAGVPYPKDNWTWNDFFEAAKALTRDGTWGYTQNLTVANPVEAYSFWAWSNDGEILSEDKTKTLWDSPGTVEAIKWVTDLRHKHKVMPNEGDLKALRGAGVDPFAGGKVAMNYANVGGFGNWQTVKDLDFDILPFPISPKGKRVVWHSQSGYYIAHNTKVPDQAFTTLMYIGSEKAMKQLGVTRATMPSNKAAAHDPNGWLKPPPKNVKLSVDVISYARPQPWVFPNAVEWYSVVTKELDYVGLGERSAEEATKNAVLEGDRVLRKR